MHITEKRAAFLRQERINKNLTQQQLAKKMYVTANAVSKWEIGKSFPEPDHLKPLARIFGCTVEELLEGERNPFDVSDSTARNGSQDAFAGSSPASASPRQDEGIPMPDAGPVPAAGIRKPVRIALSAFALLAAAIELLALYWYFRPPAFEIVDSFYGDKIDTHYFDNAYCFMVEHRGHCGPEEKDAFADSIKEEYLTLFDEVDVLLIMFFSHYDPETDYIDTADCCIYLLPPHQEQNL